MYVCMYVRPSSLRRWSLFLLVSHPGNHVPVIQSVLQGRVYHRFGIFKTNYRKRRWMAYIGVVFISWSLHICWDWNSCAEADITRLLCGQRHIMWYFSHLLCPWVSLNVDMAKNNIKWLFNCFGTRCVYCKLDNKEDQSVWMFPSGESIAGESAAKAGVLVGIFHPTLEPRLAGGSCEILDDNHSKQKTKDGDLVEKTKSS